MSTAEQRATDTEPTGETDGPDLGLAPDPVEVRRRAGVAALVAAASSGVAIAYLGRATASASWLDWSLVVVMGLLAVVWLRAFLDARTPLLVADDMGVRLRLGGSWRGLPWSAVKRVEHQPRRGLLRDGRLTVVPHNEERVVAELEGSAARHARWASRLYGGPLAIPLGLGTRVQMSGDDVTEALERLAERGHSSIVVVPVSSRPGTDEPAPVAGASVPDESGDVANEEDARPAASGRAVRLRLRDPRPLLAGALTRVSTVLPFGRAEAGEETGDEAEEAGPSDGAEAVEASERPAPARPVVEALRTETVRLSQDSAPDDPGAAPHRTTVELVEDDEPWGDRVRPIAREGHAVAPLVLDDFSAVPADDPVIGPELRAARTRLRLSVEELAERTRIRPHVIEAIEVDDFVPCGGDFYARGHLRTLARVLGVDVTGLLAHYDDRYAHAPVDPRRVFEAELATGAHGSIRGTRGGPNWSALVAALMAVVLLWSVARLVMDDPPEMRGETPVLNGSGGPHGGASVAADPVEVLVTAPSGGARVVVRDSSGAEVFEGTLAIGESRSVKASPPVRVQTSDGSVTVSVAGVDRGPVGDQGQVAQGTYAAD